MFDFSFKEVYDTALFSTQPMEIGERKIEAGEKIAVFDKILVSTFNEDKQSATAHGGYGDRPHIFWETTKDIRVSLTQGVFSKTQMALMTNTKLFTKDEGHLFISRREIIESDETGRAFTKYDINNPVFIYDAETGERIEAEWYGHKVHVGAPYKTIIVDYQYYYDNGITTFSFGRNLTNQYLSLEGKTRVKDDITGEVITGILKIPKLRLTSNLSIRLGQNATPMTNQLSGLAVPVGPRGHETVMEMHILSDDIDSDM